MRKITLFFMSMFLMVGTMVAQKDEEGPKDFNSPIVYPNSESRQTIVYNIRMEFSKDVAVTLPEGGIDVVNTTTQEVVKIATYRVDDWAPHVAVFEFEQKMAPGKDGKDELQPQYIETAGTYTYTIPSGCIKSVDGDEFPETTFTFTVIATFPIINYSPVETEDTIKNIVLTFDKEVTKVALPEYPLTIYNSSWQTAATVKDATINEDKKSVTLILSDSISTPDQYMMNFYEGIIIAADEINASKELYFTVIDTKPSFSTTYEDGDKVKELSSVFEITFKNVDKVELKQETMTVIIPGDDEVGGTATYVEAEKKIIVSFNQTFTEEGKYTFYIPAGMFTMDGVENEEREVEVTLYSFEIVPLEVVSVTPEAGTIGTITKVVVRFNQAVQLSFDENWQQISREIKLKGNDKEYTLTYNSEYKTSTSNELEYLPNAEYINNQYVSTPITEAGTYTLDLADIVVDYAAENGVDEYGYPATIWHAKNQSCLGTLVWNVTGDAAVDHIEVVGGEKVIYDILGRRVEKITGAGIYIVNGKKMVVK